MPNQRLARKVVNVDLCVEGVWLQRGCVLPTTIPDRILGRLYRMGLISDSGELRQEDEEKAEDPRQEP